MRVRKLSAHTKESAKGVCTSRDDSAIRMIRMHAQDANGRVCAHRREKVCPLIGILTKYACFCEKNDSETPSPPFHVESYLTLSVSAR